MGDCLGFQEEEKTHPTMTRRPPPTALKVTLGSSPSPTPTPSLRLSTLPPHSRTDSGTPWPSACGMHLCPHFLSCAQWDTRACSHNYTHTPTTLPHGACVCTTMHTQPHRDSHKHTGLSRDRCHTRRRARTHTGRCTHGHKHHTCRGEDNHMSPSCPSLSPPRFCTAKSPAPGKNWFGRSREVACCVSL